MPFKKKQNHQPYCALQAHLLTELRDCVAAQKAYAKAIGLTEDPAIRKFLMGKAHALELQDSLK